MNHLNDFLRWAFGGAYPDETDAEYARRVILSGIGTILALILGAIMLFIGIAMGLAL